MATLGVLLQTWDWEPEDWELGVTCKDAVWSSISSILHSPGRKASSYVLHPLLGRNHVQAFGHTGLARGSVRWPGLWTPTRTRFPSWFWHLLAMWPGARALTSPPFPFLWSGENDHICSTELPEGRWDKVCKCLARWYHGRRSKITGYIFLV